MYQLTHNITIAGRRLRLLEKVVIHRSVENLADTATITLPAYRLRHPITLKDKDGQDQIHEGDTISISLGYDDQLETEFTGYIDDIITSQNSIEIRCMDPLWLFKNTSVKDEAHGKIKAKDLLNHICQQVDPNITVNCDYDFTYDKFIIRKATAYDVLTKIHEEIKADIYFEDGTLHLHPPYSVVNEKTVKLDFARNIESSDLKYIRAKDRKIEVVVTIKKPNGDKVEKKYGTDGGQKIALISPSEDALEAQNIAENEYNSRCFEGYEGSITGWLIPYVQPAMAILLHDDDLPERDGKYYVVATETTYSKNGGQRKITLGRRLS